MKVVSNLDRIESNLEIQLKQHLTRLHTVLDKCNKKLDEITDPGEWTDEKFGPALEIAKIQEYLLTQIIFYTAALEEAQAKRKKFQRRDPNVSE